MLEVCSTSLPQLSIPLVMGDPRYKAHLDARRRMFEHRAQEAWQNFQGVAGVRVIKPQGAFYMSVMFEDGVLNGRQTLEIENPNVKAHIEEIVQGVEVDKRFVYYLLGATGICVVPLTGFAATARASASRCWKPTMPRGCARGGPSWMPSPVIWPRPDLMVDDSNPRWLDWAREIQSLAQTGLAFTKSHYDPALFQPSVRHCGRNSGGTLPA